MVLLLDVHTIITHRYLCIKKFLVPMLFFTVYLPHLYFHIFNVHCVRAGDDNTVNEVGKTASKLHLVVLVASALRTMLQLGWIRLGILIMKMSSNTMHSYLMGFLINVWNKKFLLGVANYILCVCSQYSCEFQKSRRRYCTLRKGFFYLDQHCTVFHKIKSVNVSVAHFI